MCKRLKVYGLGSLEDLGGLEMKAIANNSTIKTIQQSNNYLS